jgi:glycosyltransferase involved in cell wall biosynthesis
MPDSACDVALLMPNLAGGGAERVFLALAEDFQRRGYRVELVVMNRQGPLNTVLPASLPLVDLEASRLRQAVLPLVGYLRRRRPTTVMAALWPLTSAAVWAAKMARVDTRVVVTDHTDYLSGVEGRSLGGRLQLATLMRASYPMAAGAVSVSQGVARTVKRLSGVTPDTIYNPIPEPGEGELDPACAGPWIAHSGPRLIAMGTLKEQKDYPTLLRAFAALREDVDAQLLILGDGALRAELEAERAALGLDGAVHMPGFLEHPGPYLRHADLFVHSAAWEGFGNVLVEALACGVPVVTTDCPSGPAEILDDGRYGRLVPVADPAALARAMAAALKDPRDAERLKARARDFSVEKAADAYLRLLFGDGAA